MRILAIVGNYRRQAARIASKLFGAIRRRAFSRLTFLSLRTFDIQQRSWQRMPANSIDFRYWQNQGWLEPGRTFYIAHQAHPVKVGLARLTGALVARLVSQGWGTASPHSPAALKSWWRSSNGYIDRLLFQIRQHPAGGQCHRRGL